MSNNAATPQTVYMVAEGYHGSEHFRFGFTNEADADRYAEVLRAAGELCGHQRKIQIDNPDAFRYVKRACWDVMIVAECAEIEPPYQTTAFQLPEVTDEVLSSYPRYAALRSYVSAQHATLIAKEFRRQKFPPVEVKSC